jgi:Tfp pilus assembly protein FimT
MLRKNDGFSLNELMIILGIIALICGMAMPSILGYVPKYRIDE